MSGGGGGYYSRDRDPVEFGKKIRDAETKNLSDKYLADVAKEIGDLLAKYNNRDTESINRHISTILQKLQKELEGSVELNLAGSVSKHTYIDGFSDVDALLVLNSSELKDKSPQQAKEIIAKLIQERLPSTKVEVGSTAIKVSFEKIDIQLLPAVKSDSDYQIGNKDGSEWSSINPKAFTDKLTATNKELSGKLIPTIKLVKSIFAQQSSEKKQLDGYHIEALAIQAFKNYNGGTTHREMLRHFFDKAKDLVLRPMKDSSGQSIHVDDSLGAVNSIPRLIVSGAMDRISKRMETADAYQSSDRWKALLTGE